jgi:hypothetical protein
MIAHPIERKFVHSNFRAEIRVLRVNTARSRWSVAINDDQDHGRERRLVLDCEGVDTLSDVSFLDALFSFPKVLIDVLEDGT